MHRYAWLLPMLATLLIALLVNGALLAFSYGKLEQRVMANEAWRNEIREEWAAARERVEREVKELRAEIKTK